MTKQHLTWPCDQVGEKPPLHRGTWETEHTILRLQCSGQVIYGLGSEKEERFDCDCICHEQESA